MVFMATSRNPFLFCIILCLSICRPAYVADVSELGTTVPVSLFFFGRTIVCHGGCRNTRHMSVLEKQQDYHHSFVMSCYSSIHLCAVFFFNGNFCCLFI